MYGSKEEGSRIDDKSTMNIMNNIANLYFKTGMRKEAEVMFTRCMEKMKAKFGVSDPDT